MEDFQASYISAAVEGDVGLVRFKSGSLGEEENIEQLGRELFTLIDHFGWRKILVSMEGVRYLNSSALGKLISLHRKLHRNDGALVICNVGPEVAQVMATSHLDQYFRFAETTQQAREVLKDA